MTTAASSAVPPAGEPTSPGAPRDEPSGGEQGTIDVTRDGGTIVITVREHLDAAAGRALVAAATDAVRSEGAHRLDIDLRELGSFTAEGADALVSCRALGAQLADGLHYRTGRGAGRTALLSAYRADDTGEMQAIVVREGDGTTAQH